MADRRVTLAAVTGAHGVTGEVRLKLFGEGVAALKRYRAFNDGALTVPRSAMPALAEGEYYHADLIGLPAVSTAGEPLGVCVAVDNFGAGDVLEIERVGDDGKRRRFMVPMTPSAVPEWCEHTGLVVDAAYAE